MFDADCTAAEQPAFELVSLRTIGLRIVEQRQPCALLAFRCHRQMPDRARTDLLLGVERTDAREQIAECEDALDHRLGHRSEEHTSELQSLMRISYAVFCLKKKKKASNK